MARSDAREVLWVSAASTASSPCCQLYEWLAPSLVRDGVSFKHSFMHIVTRYAQTLWGVALPFCSTVAPDHAACLPVQAASQSPPALCVYMQVVSQLWVAVVGVLLLVSATSWLYGYLAAQAAHAACDRLLVWASAAPCDYCQVANEGTGTVFCGCMRIQPEKTRSPSLAAKS